MINRLQNWINTLYEKKSPFAGVSVLDIIIILYRMMFTVFTVFIVSRFTSLADIGQYLNSSLTDSLPRFFLSSTDHLVVLTQIVKAIVRYDLLVHIFFCLAGTTGILYLTRNQIFRKNAKSRFAIFLFLIPTFTIWSSITTKEAIMVCMGFILVSEMLDIYHNGKINNIAMFLISLAYVCFFKPWFSMAIFHFLLAVLIWRGLKLNSKQLLLVIGLSALLQAVVLFFVSGYLNEFAQWTAHDFVFRPDARSARISPFTNGENFFSYLPLGYFLTLWGPTVTEVKTTVLHLFAFIESSFLFGVLLVFVIYKIINVIQTKKLNILNLYLAVTTWFWILLLSYPMGVYNPGSAIRYRTDFYIFLLFTFFFKSITKKEKV